MAFEDFLPTIGVAVGALATLGGVGITTRAAAKTEARRVAVEQKREDARIAREDAEKATEEQRAKITRSAESYREVADLFLGEFSTVRSWHSAIPANDESGFEEWYGNQWSAHGEARLMRAVAKVKKNERRGQLDRVVEAISLFPNIATITYQRRSWLVEKTAKVGFDLASAWARGQEADDDLFARFEDVNSDVALIHDAYENDREARRQAATTPKRASRSKNPTATS